MNTGAPGMRLKWTVGGMRPKGLWPNDFFSSVKDFFFWTDYTVAWGCCLVMAGAPMVL